MRGVMRHRGFIVLAVIGTLVVVWLSIRSDRARSPADQVVEEHEAPTIDVPATPSSVPTEPRTTDKSPEAAVPGEQSTEDVATSNQEQESDPADPLTAQRTRMNAAMRAATALAPTFLSESRDRTWAEIAEAELSGRIAQSAGLELTTLRIECRETVCRIDFTFPTLEYARASGGAMATAAVNGTPDYKTGGLILFGEDGS